MKSPRKTTLTILAASLAAVPVLLFAQNPPQPPSPTESQVRIRSNSSLVVLPVTVKDRSGNLVPDLHRDEFRVFEDNVEQSIDVFSADAFPLSMVILIDNDLKSKDADQVESSLKAIVAGMSLSDEAEVCRFDQFFHEGKGFTSDQDRLLTELKRLPLDSKSSTGPPSSAISSGPTINGHSATSNAPNIEPGLIAIKGESTKALDDAVFSAAELLHNRGNERERRRIILLVSDGQNGGKKVNKNTYDNVVKTLTRNKISVYSVAVSSAFLERKLSRLIDYSKDSGGDMFFAAKRDSLEEFYSQITEEARNQYTLAYVPRGTDRGVDYHTIEVRVKREGLTIKTRDHYYSGLPQPGTAQ